MAKLRTKKTELGQHLNKNKKIKEPINSNVPVSTIYSFRSYRPPSDINEQYELLCEFVEWALNTSSVNPIDFPIMKRLNPHYFFKLAYVNETFSDMIDFVRYKFASHLEQNPVVSPNYTASKIRYFDKEYGAWNRSEVSKIIEERMKINVIMQEIPKTNMVPERKIND